MTGLLINGAPVPAKRLTIAKQMLRTLALSEGAASKPKSHMYSCGMCKLPTRG